MTPLLLISIVATIGAAMGLVHAIRDERRKREAPAAISGKEVRDQRVLEAAEPAKYRD